MPQLNNLCFSPLRQHLVHGLLDNGPLATGEATRLVEFARMSPSAKNPGQRVSSENRGRAIGHFISATGWKISRPVQTKPCSSTCIDSGTNSVFGDAPMNANRYLICRTTS
ncbi:MAG: hypothetical protein WD005_03410 [Haliea sp.]